MKKQILLILGMLVLAAAFQNCAQSSTDEAASENPSNTVSDEKFMAYPYAAKSEFMGDIRLLEKHKIDATTSRIVLQGIIVNVDAPTAAVAYEIRWLGQSGQDVCPAFKGATTNLKRIIQYGCVATDWGRLLTAQIYAYSNLQKKWILVRELRSM